jgi:hypothetical protein
VCGALGYTGLFKNTDTKEFNGEVFGAANQGGEVAANEEEAVFELAPGESVQVEFVWSCPGRAPSPATSPASTGATEVSLGRPAT